MPEEGLQRGPHLKDGLVAVLTIHLHRAAEHRRQLVRERAVVVFGLGDRLPERVEHPVRRVGRTPEQRMMERRSEQEHVRPRAQIGRVPERLLG